MKTRRTRTGSFGNAYDASSDIAFLLIIFFIVTSGFVLKDGIHLTLPSVGAQPEVVVTHKIAHIAVNEDGNAFFEERMMALPELGEAIARRIETDEETIVLVEIDKRARYQAVIRVIDTVKLANAAKISLRIKE